MECPPPQSGGCAVLAVTLSERGQPMSYYLAESSNAWRGSGLRTLVAEVIAPVLESGRKAGEQPSRLP